MVTEPLRPAAGLTYVGAYAVCVEDGRILLVRIRDETPDDGRWTLPGGGLRWGESPEAGVLRELQEETGLTGEIEGVLGPHSDVYPRSIIGAGRPLHFLGFLFRVRITGGELRDERDSTTDMARWIPLEEARRLPHVPVVGRVLAGLLPNADEFAPSAAAAGAGPP